MHGGGSGGVNLVIVVSIFEEKKRAERAENFLALVKYSSKTHQIAFCARSAPKFFDNFHPNIKPKNFSYWRPLFSTKGVKIFDRGRVKKISRGGVIKNVSRGGETPSDPPRAHLCT